MRKLIFLFVTAASVVVIIGTGCKKTTNNTTVVKDSVYYSSWTPLVMQFDNTDSVYYQDFQNSKITSAIISRGAVLGYFGAVSNGDTTVSNASEWSAYPFGVFQQLQVGVLDISSFIDLSYSGGGFLYRYVLIPGNVLANSSLKNMSKDQLNKMSFTDIQQVLKNAQNSTAGGQPTLTGN